MTLKNNMVATKQITNVRLFIFFVLLFLANTGVFGQNKLDDSTVITSTDISIIKDSTIVISSESNIASTTMDFAVWFTGTKNTSIDNKFNNGLSKKQLINSGVKTNSVLIRSLLKKISYQGNDVA